MLTQIALLAVLAAPVYCNIAGAQPRENYIRIGPIILGKSTTADIERVFGKTPAKIGFHPNSARIWRLQRGVSLTVDGAHGAGESGYVVDRVLWIRENTVSAPLIHRNYRKLSFRTIEIDSSRSAVDRILGHNSVTREAYGRKANEWRIPLPRRQRHVTVTIAYEGNRAVLIAVELDEEPGDTRIKGTHKFLLGRVLAESSVVRTSRSLKSPILSRVPAGTFLVVRGEREGFYGIRMKHGSPGYIPTRDVHVEELDMSSGHLVEAELPVQAGGQTELLWTAVDRQDLAMLKNAIAVGGNVNATRTGMRTVLMQAAGWSNVEVVKTLARNGAKINQRDKDGTTALIYAIDQGRFDNAKRLLELRADPNIRDKHGHSAMYWASNEHETHDKTLTHDHWVRLRKILRHHGAR